MDGLCKLSYFSNPNEFSLSCDCFFFCCYSGSYEYTREPIAFAGCPGLKSKGHGNQWDLLPSPLNNAQSSAELPAIILRFTGKAWEIFGKKTTETGGAQQGRREIRTVGTRT